MSIGGIREANLLSNASRRMEKKMEIFRNESKPPSYGSPREGGKITWRMERRSHGEKGGRQGCEIGEDQG